MEKNWKQAPHYQVSSYFPLPLFLLDEERFPSTLGGLPLRLGVWLPPFNFLEEGDGLGLLRTGRDVEINKTLQSNKKMGHVFKLIMISTHYSNFTSELSESWTKPLKFKLKT